MSEKLQDDGGPAFPVQELNGDGSPATLSLGISIRDHFAGLAMQALISREFGKGENHQHALVAITAKSYADALIQELKGVTR